MTAPDLEDEFLTVAQVAETLKLNQQTVRNWIDAGSLPAVRVGRRVRIRRSDFEQVLANGYSGGGGGASPGRVARGGSAGGGGARAAPPPGPSAEDFWGGEPVGTVDAPPRAGGGA